MVVGHVVLAQILDPLKPPLLAPALVRIGRVGGALTHVALDRGLENLAHLEELATAREAEAQVLLLEAREVVGKRQVLLVHRLNVQDQLTKLATELSVNLYLGAFEHREIKVGRHLLLRLEAGAVGREEVVLDDRALLTRLRVLDHRRTHVGHPADVLAHGLLGTVENLVAEDLVDGVRLGIALGDGHLRLPLKAPTPAPASLTQRALAAALALAKRAFAALAALAAAVVHATRSIPKAPTAACAAE